jgi:hypothetical protein
MHLRRDRARAHPDDVRLIFILSAGPGGGPFKLPGSAIGLGSFYQPLLFLFRSVKDQ